MQLIGIGTGAVFRHEMRAIARWRFRFLIRYAVLVFTAIVLIAVLLDSPLARAYRYASGRSAALAGFGREWAGGTSVGLYVLLMIVMPAAMGGLLAVDREKGRLELLRMTPLDATQIVLEKFLSRVAYALHWIVLGLPFFLLPLIFGGVTPFQMFLAVTFPVLAAVWVSAAALLVSTPGRSPIGTVAATYLVCIAFVLPGITLMGEFRLQQEWYFHAFPLASLACLPVEAFWDGFLGSRGPVQIESLMWQIPLEVLAFASFAILVASWRLRREDRGREARTARGIVGGGRIRVWDRAVIWKEVRMAEGTGMRRLMAMTIGLYVAGFLFLVAGLLLEFGHVRIDVGRFVRVPSLMCAQGAVLVAWAAAILGLCAAAAAAFPRRATAAGAVMIGALGIAVVSLLIILLPWDFGISYKRHAYFDERIRDVLGGSSLLLCALLGSGAVVVSAVSVAAERARGTLDSLRLTPLPAGAILDGKAMGCFGALVPGLVMLVVHVTLLCVFYGFRPGGAVLFLVSVLAWVTVLVQAGIRVSTPSRGPVRALMAVTVLMVLYGGLNAFLFMLFGVFGSLGLYVNPVYWLMMALAWGGGSDPAAVWRVAPLWAYGLMLLGCGGVAWAFRKASVRIFEARRGA